MKSVLLLVFFVYAGLCADAQVNTLPAGKYETTLKNHQKWEKGDIVLLDDSRYKITTSGEIGEYRFSVSAQRVFFMSGPLKGVYAKTTQTSTGPVIVIPVAENEQIGLKQATADIAGYLRQ
ncbi:MAG TPA: hypothetical protein VFZ78_01020 [Flavisolibacter sp.]